ncbi:pilin [Hahella ganghwensis]|uniref:pilin n=1 Tax=Hahella ganghwensis TaxID=286420 RepID=UPI0012FA091F|nr:prepilin-type N-terminal cleavage/methylation domain-containing protein [Hahella ganghwensis]
MSAHLTKHSSQGFTLLELMIAITILAILLTLAIPRYDRYMEKSRLTDLVTRIDALRTSAATAFYADGVSLNFKPVGPGAMPLELEKYLISDSMFYPDISMQIVTSNKTFQPFTGGKKRLYLMLSAQNKDGAEKLTLLSQILPHHIWGWWGTSVSMMVSLQNSAWGEPKPTNVSPSSTGGATGGSTGGQTSSTTLPPASALPPQPQGGLQPPPSSTSTKSDSSGSSQTSQGTGSTTPTFSGVNNPAECIHPGNGHAYGRCRHQNHGHKQ